MPRSAAHTESRYRFQLDPADVVSQPQTHLEMRHAEALARKASIVKISSGAGSEKGGLNRVYWGKERVVDISIRYSLGMKRQNLRE